MKRKVRAKEAENLKSAATEIKAPIIAEIDHLHFNEHAFALTLDDLQEQMKMLVTLCRFHNAPIEVIYVFNKLGEMPISDFFSAHLTEKYDYPHIFTRVKYNTNLTEGFYVYIQHAAGKQLIDYTSRKNSMSSFGDIRGIQVG